MVAIVLGGALLLAAAFAFGTSLVTGSTPRSKRRCRRRASRHEGRRRRAEGGLERSRGPATGSVQALQETVLYARASGFVRRWLVDMGDKVTAGQLLAEIETPELDQELEQANAVLAQARPTLARSKANRVLSGANLERYKQLTPEGVASQADLDQHQAQAQVDEADVSVAEATISAQQANIRRLTQLKAFSRVTAPFAGTITQRGRGRGARDRRATGSLFTAWRRSTRRASSCRCRRTSRPASAPTSPLR